jgi:hypothetical protein
MGALFERAEMELALALVRVLAGMNTDAAKQAISAASRSPFAVVRIEALGHVEGVSSERLRLELRGLLEDKEPGVRLAALRAMEKYAIKVVGPFLVLRIKDSDFDALPLEERRQAFATLATLAPSRAEQVALEVAKDAHLVPSEKHEESRVLAVEALGRLGNDPEVLKTLEALSTQRWRNSERVRNAASRASGECLKRHADEAEAKLASAVNAPAKASPAKKGGPVKQGALKR